MPNNRRAAHRFPCWDRASVRNRNSAGHSSNQIESPKYESGHSQSSGFTGVLCFSRSNAVLPLSARMHMSVYRSSSSGHSSSTPSVHSSTMLFIKRPGSLCGIGVIDSRSRAFPIRATTACEWAIAQWRETTAMSILACDATPSSGIHDAAPCQGSRSSSLCVPAFISMP